MREGDHIGSPLRCVRIDGTITIVPYESKGEDGRQIADYNTKCNNIEIDFHQSKC